ncbi:MAG: T9SS type A sorting domain-containing protein, partial [Bacteroidota bacterium]
EVYNVVRSMTHLRESHDVFQTTDFQVNVAQNPKAIHLNDNDVNVAILGNFDVQAANVTPNFQHVGWWYEYFSGDSLNVSSTTAALNFQPGEYRLYTDVKLAKLPDFVDAEEEFSGGLKWHIAPNPAAGEAKIFVELAESQTVRLAVFDGQGRLAGDIFEEKLPGGLHSFSVPEGLAKGIYFVQLVVNGKVEVRKLVVN